MNRTPSKVEFIALMAMLYATIAFSIDAMMPALPTIAAELSPDAPHAAQLVITTFVLGMGVGTLFAGPLSDRLGRRPVLLGGIALYLCAALLATRAEGLTAVLALRFIQGLGASGPRVVALAVIRDVYAGRGMAQIMSFVMMIFSLVPAIAPYLGQQIVGLAGWHSIFYAFALFGLSCAIWLYLRLPETLRVADRKPFRAGVLWAAIREVLSHPLVRRTIMVQGFCFAMLFSVISTIQPIYDEGFGMAEAFPKWFALTAVLAAFSSYVNSRVVMRLGMRRIVGSALLVQIVATSLLITAILSGLEGIRFFAVFLIWQQIQFFQAGLTLGNLNALAMEPMGHIAGMAASVIGAVSTVIAVLLAIPVGLAFDGTPLPLAVAILVYAGMAFWLMQPLLTEEAPAA
jgi:DHA1 family bicyclomycin/chloramphenicol resistance-like MFS transporter